MKTVLLGIGRLAGVVGVLVCLIAAAVRLTGAFWVGGFQAGTLFLAGVAAMTFGCLTLLMVLTLRTNGDR
ncbi:MAG TPA: hypothetical protein P5149_07220 [Candidatus Competibacteraceae bacterium]|nr:hypothetical protein [Candidatus Competibacteraceae bacterium]MCP5134940.1 hypothetical protein [Gammaproteobacteria bacterium]HPF58856.1 hypothetical protein [Candidatus Competibacteraceae bacterium]HRY18182.1 hypothetical protein [Candidatus Competibacteraceae bacterium]